MEKLNTLKVFSLLKIQFKIYYNLCYALPLRCMGQMGLL